MSNFPGIDKATSMVAQMSYNAIRVPPIQFDSYVGNPPRLITSDVVSGCGSITLPAPLAAIMKMLKDGTAFIDQIANSISVQIQSALGTMTSQLNSMMSSATSALNAGVAQLNGMLSQATGAAIGQISGFIGTATNMVNGAIGQVGGMVSSMASSAINQVNEGINNMVMNMPSSANMIGRTSDLHSALGLPPLPPLSSIYAPIVNGGFDAALGGVMNSVNVMQAAVGGAIPSNMNNVLGAVGTAIGDIQSAIGGTASLIGTAIDSAISTATTAVNAATSVLSSTVNAVTSVFDSAVNAAMSTVNALMSSMTSAIQSAMSSLTHLVNAAALHVMCAGATQFNGFMNSIASPALKAVMPTPI